jgi:5-methylcytosine-specific restriction enzyme subunit McrC
MSVTAGSRAGAGLVVGPAPVLLTEYGPARDGVRLPSDVAAAVRRTGLVEVRPTTAPGQWSLVPRGKVGAVQVAGHGVHVAPKLSIARLMFLLEYAPDRPVWQREQVGLEEHLDLLHVMAAVFTRTTDRATRGGLLQGYRTVEDSLPVLRGRVREADQLRLWQGRALPVEVRYDEFTADIAENRLLLAATRRLLRLPQLTTRPRRELLQLRQRLAEVSDLVRGTPAPTWTPSRLNVHYQPALRLAELVLAGSSFEHRAGPLAVRGFVLDLPRVFEDFVTKALRSALAPRGGRVEGQPTVFLDDDALIRTRPDVVWLDGRRPLAVVDAKYKAEKPSGFPDADLYQALAYATALALPAAHLVYARGNGAARTYRVRHAGVRLIAHALDLSRPPTQLLAQVSAIADQIERSQPPGPTAR